MIPPSVQSLVDYLASLQMTETTRNSPDPPETLEVSAKIVNNEGTAYSPLSLLQGGEASLRTVFPFEALNKDCQNCIIRYVLDTARTVFPYYRRGMLFDGPWSKPYQEGDIDYGVADKENVDLALLRVNKHFHDRGTKIFYGQNIFLLKSAEICKWWFKHIGPKNFSCIRKIGFSLWSGFIHGDRRSVLEPCEEELWLGVLHWMKDHHQLNYLRIHLKKWQDPEYDKSLTEDEKDTILKYRHKISDLLPRYRGIQSVKISNHKSLWYSKIDEHMLALLMQQPSR